MKKTILTGILALFLFMNFAFAGTYYNNTGHKDSYFNLGRGAFNAQLTETNDYIKAFSAPAKNPLVTDLNRDNALEIIILNGDVLTLMNSKTLTINSTLDLSPNGTGTLWSNMVVFDIDGDGFDELMIAEESTTTTRRVIWIVNYTSSLQVQKSLNLISSNYQGGQVMLGCKGVDDCVAIVVERAGSDTDNGDMDIASQGFNSSIVTGVLTIASHNGASASNRNGLFCFPTIRTISANDYDGTGDIEFIFSYAYISEQDTQSAFIVWLNSTPKSQVVQHSASQGSSAFDMASSFGCNSVAVGSTYPLGFFFTSPIVDNFDDSYPNKEAFMGVSSDINSFKVYEWDSSGDEKFNTFPQVEDGEGVMISNMFRGNYFEDSQNNKDVCVVGYDSDSLSFGMSQRVDLVCGNRFDGYGVETREFISDSSINVTKTYDSHAVISHSIQEDNSINNNLIDQSELLTSHGVFKVNNDCTTSGDCTMTRIFANPYASGAMISADFDRFGSDDLILLTSTNLYYLDDGLSNEPALITSITSNPCYVNSVWQINGTIQLSVVVEDQNPPSIGQDAVSASVIIYAGSSNEFRINSGNFTSGTTIPFNFVVNQTISSGTITVLGRDSVNLNDEDEQTLTFSVGNEGLVFGDSSCTTDFETPTGGTGTNTTIEEGLEADLNDNFVTDSVIQINTIFKIGGVAIWLLIMLMFNGYFIYLHSKGHDSVIKHMDMKTLALVLAGMDFIWLILGSVLAIMSWGIILMILIFAVAIVVIFLTQKFTGNNQGG